MKTSRAPFFQSPISKLHKKNILHFLIAILAQVQGVLRKKQLTAFFVEHFKENHENTIYDRLLYKSSHHRYSLRKGVLRSFAKVTGKHLCQSLFFNNVACNFVKKETLVEVLSCEFCEFFMNTFFTEHLRTTASHFTVVI